MREHHSFWTAGRAGGVDNQGHVVIANRGMGRGWFLGLADLLQRVDFGAGSGAEEVGPASAEQQGRKGRQAGARKESLQQMKRNGERLGSAVLKSVANDAGSSLRRDIDG